MDKILCPKCSSELRYYDKVKRIVRTKNGESYHIYIKRYKCYNCRKVYRILPPMLKPYKQYESEIIIGVIEGLITSGTIGFEDYPCDMTMKRWITLKKHGLL